MRSAGPHRRRDETLTFRVLLVQLRQELGWQQDDLASKLQVSKRTLSHWECGHWLPPFKQRLHVVAALRDAPPEYVLAVADALGVSVNPAVAPMLQPFKDALDPPEPVLAPSPPPRARVDADGLRRALDAIVWSVADEMNVAANDLRALVGRALAAGGEMGATLEELRDAVAVKRKAKSATSVEQ